jgi:butyrate kinase
MEFLVPIVAMVTSTVAVIFMMKIRSDGQLNQKVQELEKLQAEMETVQARLNTLEQLVTDKKFQLDQELSAINKAS